MRRRIEEVRRRIAELEIDAFLATSLVNIRYLFGFTGSHALAVITSERSVFVTDRRYHQQAHEEVVGAEILVALQDLYAPLKKTRVLHDDMKLAFEAAHLTVKQFTRLRKAFPRNRLIAAEGIVEHLASVKDEDEIEAIRQGGKICGEVYSEILPMIREGVRELDISAEISYRCKRHGSEKDPFEPIVASGQRSALPHGISSHKTVQPGELVVLDFGAVVHGYVSDFTRTVVVGEASQRQVEMARVVLEALTLAQHFARPGILGKELDKVARDYMAQHGYAPYFLHSLGHGLGLALHGIPRIGMRSNDPLQSGNVITLEPGVYLADVGGVRIEDDFVVTENGVENLTPFPRELVCVG